MTPCQPVGCQHFSIIWARHYFGTPRHFCTGWKIKALVVVCVWEERHVTVLVLALVEAPSRILDQFTHWQWSQECALVSFLSSGELMFVQSVVDGQRGRRQQWRKEKKGKRKEKWLKFIIYLNISNNKHLYLIERKPLDSQDKQDKYNLQEVPEAPVCLEALRFPNKQKSKTFSCQTQSHDIVDTERETSRSRYLCEDFLCGDGQSVWLNPLRTNLNPTLKPN